MSKAWGWTRADVLGLTYRQLHYYANEGKAPRVADPNRRKFSSPEEARAWRAAERERLQQSEDQ